MADRTPADSYFDVAELWEQVVARGGLRYRLDNHGKATYLRQRINTWRKRQRSLLAERTGIVEGKPITTPYDFFKVRVEHATTRTPLKVGRSLESQGFTADEQYDVVFMPVSLEEHQGKMLDLDGNEVEPVDPKPLYEDDEGLGLE